MRINHNISSLRALNQMHKSNFGLDKTLERLSSGRRINHAADDAAGLAISQKMDTQVRGLGQANRNAMDGISLIQTAEGALSEVHAMLQRIRELSIQVSNGTYDASDRKQVQAEVDELKSEILRISTDTEFNEKKLLNGELDNRVFSDNTNIADSVSVSMGVEPEEYKFTVSQKATKASMVATETTADLYTGTAPDEKTKIAGKISIGKENITIEKGNSREEVVGKLRELADKSNLDMKVSGKKITFTDKEYGDKSIKFEGETALLAALGLNGVAPNSVMTKGKDFKIDPASINATNKFPEGVAIDPSKSGGRYVTLRGNDDFEIKLEGAVGAAATTGAVTLSILETGPLNLQIGANEGQFMSLKVPELSPRTLGIREINLITQDGAQKAISTVDDAINIVSAVRSRLGAYQNRLEHTTANLEAASENLTASMSRIEDADMAYEMSQFTQKNIIAQAGNSMLAQANQRPQQLLQLLQRG